MSKLDNITIERVKDSASIVDVISEFYTLKRNGKNYTCLCPFHEDRHMGNFVVSPSKNIYNCFSCGAKGDAIQFLTQHEGMSFKEAIMWLGSKYGIPVDGAENYNPKPCKPRPQVEPLEILEIPIAFCKQFSDVSENSLYKWIKNQYWTIDQQERVDKMFKNYAIGSGKDGHAIFWYIDDGGVVRTAKMMLYGDDGHRDKKSSHNFDWVHTILEKTNAFDAQNRDVTIPIFGLHLVNFCPDATINIVESEKTALICAIAYGGMTKHLWMATGGLTNLTRRKLKPLIDRGCHIVLYPDKDGVQKWKEAADIIGYDKMTINTSFMEEYWRPEDGEKADIADVILRLNKPMITIDNLIEKNPSIKGLKEMGYEVTNISKIY